MASLYVYAVSYDLGFAPNPFGGLCSLACCKPKIREKAKHGDWIVGLSGTKLKPAMRCVFGMVVTADITFDDYWSDTAFAQRRPKRNGSLKKLVGDNIYHRDAIDTPWQQEDSVHSLQDGQQCALNTTHDTRVNRVLLSNRFIYFGSAAALVPQGVRNAMNYPKNSRDYRIFDAEAARPLINWLEPQLIVRPNVVVADPIDFVKATKRYSANLQKLI